MPFTADTFTNALLATIIAGFGATTLGALPAIFLRRLNEKLNNNLLSFAAGVMLAATVFSLLLPSIENSRRQGATAASAVLQAVIFLFVGGFVLWLINELVPVSIWAMNFAMMFALALGIDYALFLVVRYRAARAVYDHIWPIPR